MNVSRRVCCQATNAFRPGLALKNVFAGPIDRRCALTATLSASNEGCDTEGVVPYGVRGQGNRRAAHKRLKQHTADPVAVLEGDLGHETHNAEEIGHPEEHIGHFTQADGNHRFDGRVPKTTSEDVLDKLHRRRHAKSRRRADKDRSDFTSPKLAEIQKKKLAGQEQEVLEYEGFYVQPASGQETEVRVWPWTNGLRLNDKSTSIYERLGSEIVAFAKWLRQTQAELATRESVIKQTMSIVKKAGTEFEIEPFGSSRTGLSLSSSDVDLRLFKAWEQENDQNSDQASWLPKNAIPLPPKWKTRKQSLAALHVLQKRFWKHPDYIICNIRFARYPVLHMQHWPSGVDVQIVCANDTTAQREWIRRELQKRPRIAELYAVIKTMLDTRGLTDVFRGGLGSYAIFSMIVVVLDKMDYDRRQQKPQAELIAQELAKISSNELLGHDLQRVLLFWSFFDTYHQAVRVQPRAIFRKSEPDVIDDLDAASGNPIRIIDKSQPYLLCLEDPNDPTNDLGHQTYGWKHIQATFKFLSKGLKDKLDPSYTSNNMKNRSFLRDMVGTADKDYSARRTFAEAYGKAAMQSPDGIPAPGSYVKPEQPKLRSKERRSTAHEVYGQQRHLFRKVKHNVQDIGERHYLNRRLKCATASQVVSDDKSNNGGSEAEPTTSETTPMVAPDEEVSNVSEIHEIVSDASADNVERNSPDTAEKSAAAAA